MIGLGGALGANVRYLLGTWLFERAGGDFPVHTLVINVTGSLAIGFLLVLLGERLVLDPAWRLFLIVGFLGGYTTFSTFTLESFSLLREGRWIAMLAYVLASNLLGLAGVLAGVLLARLVDR